MEEFAVSAPCFSHLSSHSGRSAANRAARKWERDNGVAALDAMGGEWDADEWVVDELIRLAVVVDTLSASRLCMEVEDAIRTSAEAYADDLAFKGDELDGVLKDAPYKEKGEALRALSAAVTVDSDIAMCSVAHIYLKALEAACKD